MSFNRSEHLRGLESFLRTRVIGQDDAVHRVSQALQAAECDLNERGPRPRGAFLFMGPSGVGKTSAAKAFAEYLDLKLSMIFMNEHQSSSDAPDFIQSIVRAVNANPSGTVLLLDEIEKAHKSIIDILLSLLDEGEVTTADGLRVSVGKAYVVLTSNIGAQRWGQMLNTKYSVMEHFAFESAKRILRPELFWRLTETLVFKPLSIETQISILKLVLDNKLSYLEPKLGKLSVDEKSVNAHLLRRSFTQAGGARRLKQELDRQLNIALLPWALNGDRPGEGRFYYNAATDCLELR